MTACIGEPISWPRLERFALAAGDPAIAAHVEACPACRQCLAQIQGDVVELPPLVMRPGRPGVVAPELARRAAPSARWRWLVPVFATAAAAVIVLIVVRRPAPPIDGFGAAIGVKGVGEVTLELVRERAGATELDARRYAPGDRWKVIVSCPPRAAAVAIDVSVDDGLTVDHPLAPAQLACGNRVVVPGAFTVTGARPNRVCVTAAAAPGAEGGTACATLEPADGR